MHVEEKGIIKEIISCRDMDKVTIREDRSLGRNPVDDELVPRSEVLAGAAPYEAVALDAMFARSGSGPPVARTGSSAR